MKMRVSSVGLGAIVAVGLLTVPSFGQVIASSGFNDASGLNGDATPGSPYTVGQTVDGRGAGEPGWGTLWAVSQGGAVGGGEYARVLSAAAREGDGGLQLEPNPIFGTTRALRGLAEGQSRRFMIEQDLNFVAAGELYSRPAQGGAGGEGIRIGPQWRITGTAGNRHFEVSDGIGDQLEYWENTGIAQLPGEWQRVVLDVNVATQTWTFSVDGVTYNSPDPLGFRGQPARIDYVEYLSTSSGYIDSVVVRGVPEPGVAGVGVVLAVCGLGRRRRWR